MERAQWVNEAGVPPFGTCVLGGVWLGKCSIVAEAQSECSKKHFQNARYNITFSPSLNRTLLYYGTKISLLSRRQEVRPLQF